MADASIYDSAGFYIAKHINERTSPEELFNNWIKDKSLRPDPDDALNIYRIIHQITDNNLQKQLIEIYGGTK